MLANNQSVRNAPKEVVIKITSEKINRQSGGYSYRLYRVFEVYGIGNFSMLFNLQLDAEAVCDWHNETRTFMQKLLSGDILTKNGYCYGLDGYKYKVRERRVHSGIQHVVTTRSEGYAKFLAGSESFT